MNREIKFRAWDANNKRFLYPDPAQPRTGHVLDSNTNQPAYEHGRFHTQLIGVQMTLTGEVFQSCYYATADYAGHVLQQYIGVKDRNNKDIYEGDIVKTNPNEKNSYIARVRYLPERALYSLCGTIDDGPFREDLFLLDELEPLPPGVKYSTVRTGKIANWRLEVVGNIFENPDLLPTTKQMVEKWQKMAKESPRNPPVVGLMARLKRKLFP